jgi:hypothetical protein
MAMVSAVSVSYLPSPMAAWTSQTSPVVVDIMKYTLCGVILSNYFRTEINLLW